MKKGLGIIILVISLSLIGYAFRKDKPVNIRNSKGCVLIELFSSDGCSSCPPAEDVMRKITHTANSTGQKIYVIEFHVDYWDYLGWKDTFAHPEFTDRQQLYGNYFKLNSIYTPQAIVNGKYEMVGSDLDKINTAVKGELEATGGDSITCKVQKSNGAKVEVDYQVLGNTPDDQLNFAVIESNLETRVLKGENSKRTLVHDDVVRVFKTTNLNNSSGKILLDVSHIKLENASLICFVQNRKNMEIRGATKCLLN